MAGGSPNNYYYTKMFGRGDISYNEYSGYYQYANGDYATYDDAMNQLFSGNLEYKITWEGFNASNVYHDLKEGFDIYQVNAFGKTNYIAALGTLGEMYQSPEGAIGFSGLFVGAVIGNPAGTIGSFDNSNIVLDIGGGIFGGLKTAVTPGDQWLGKNGKYYNNSWGGNRYTGSRSGAFATANNYKWAGRVTVGVTAIIGGIQVYNGYQMDGGKFGYHASLAGTSATGSIIGGWAGAQAGASIGFAIGTWFGGIGAIPGTILGGFFGGLVGSFTGDYIGESSVNYFYGR